VTDFQDILLPDGVVGSLRASTKKTLLQDLARIAAGKVGLDARIVFEAIMERERLGSTGFGSGVAIPHARLSGLEQIVGVFARLAEPIDVDAIDGAPADLVFLLLAPEDAGADHLRALARVSRAFRRPELRERLRGAPSEDALLAILTETAPTHSDAA
jgi:PTS system nitrogen regulatory IIA component